MTSKYYDASYVWAVAVFAVYLIILQHNTAIAQVGLNCTGGDDCDERVPCPPDSELDKITGKCECNPDHCMSPQCRYTAKYIIKHNATRLPGDCCNIYECVMPSEMNCSGVVCPDTNITCPPDSLSLPRRHIEGECCSTPGGCECLPDPCRVPECNEGYKEKVIQTGTNKPGSCCPVYECQPYEAVRNTCRHEGREIPNGEKWKRGKCVECTCTKGEVQCANSVKCPPLDGCRTTYLPPEDCCPSCLSYVDAVTEPVSPEGCKSGRGAIFNNEATWYEDECTKCTCVKGEAKCQAAFCITQTCVNATWIDGECCPRCNGTSMIIAPPDCPQTLHCNLRCKNGFVRDESNCFLCKCKEEECQLHCPNGYVRDENGSEICDCLEKAEAPNCPSLSNCHKKCRFGYKINKFGCPICKCDHNCKAIDHVCNKNCPHGLQTDHKGCPICKCKGSPYNFESNAVKTSELECSTEGDIWRDNGEAWNDGCRQCYCHRGREMCALIACPKLNCPDPAITKKSCCPTCPGNETRVATQVVCYGTDGLLKLEGETWSIGCVDCICHGGRIMCNREVCPPTPCPHPLPPLPGECCPRCTTDMQPNVTTSQGCGIDRPAGSKWREGNCVSCICANGIASCFTESCHQVDIVCKTPLQVKNMCCSICLDNESHDDTSCHIGNMTYNLDSEWQPDKCTKCICKPGRTVVCAPIVCEYPCKNEDPCCPKCKDTDGRSSSYTYIPYIILCVVMFICGAGTILGLNRKNRLCCIRRHQLKICQPHPPAYPYKYVPTYEGPTPQSTPLTLKSPV